MWHGSGKNLWIVCVFFVSPAVVWSQQSATEVSRALGELNSWLGDDANARDWKAYLRSDELAAHLGKGAGADRNTVDEIRAIYARSQAGLEKRRFVAVRQALDNWLQEMQGTPTDLPARVRAAKESFRAVSPQDVSQSRNALLAAVNQADQPGLETASFSTVRHALRRYAAALRYSADEKLQETYGKNLDELATRLEALATAPKSADLTAAGRALGNGPDWLPLWWRPRVNGSADRTCLQPHRASLFTRASRNQKRPRNSIGLCESARIFWGPRCTGPRIRTCS
jgi:hypothetical protein